MRWQWDLLIIVTELDTFRAQNRMSSLTDITPNGAANRSKDGVGEIVGGDGKLLEEV